MHDMFFNNCSAKPMLLTLWGDYETEEGQTIIEMIHTQSITAALRVKVTSYRSKK